LVGSRPSGARLRSRPLSGARAADFTVKTAPLPGPALSAWTLRRAARRCGARWPGRARGPRGHGSSSCPPARTAGRCAAGNCGRMPWPVSLTATSTCAWSRLSNHLHAPALRRELDGIGEEIPRDLLQPLGSPATVPASGSRTACTRMFFASPRAGRRRSSPDHRHEIDGADIEASLPAMIRETSSRSSMSCASSARSARSSPRRAVPCRHRACPSAASGPGGIARAAFAARARPWPECIPGAGRCFCLGSGLPLALVEPSVVNRHGGAPRQSSARARSSGP